MIKIKRFDYTDHELFSIAAQIRTQVFVEEQNVPKELELDEFESQAVHFLLYLNTEPVAAARYRILNKKAKFERYAVKREWRKQGFGSYILREMIKDVKHSVEVVYLHAQESAVTFYQKHGFQIVGDKFVEANIVHYKMEYIIR